MANINNSEVTGSSRKVTSFVLPEPEVKLLTKFGYGNRSLGLRKLMGNPLVRDIIEEEIAHLYRTGTAKPAE